MDTDTPAVTALRELDVNAVKRLVVLVNGKPQMAAEGEARRAAAFRRAQTKRHAQEPRYVAGFIRGLTRDASLNADFYRDCLERYIAEHDLDGSLLRAELERVLTERGQA